MVFHFLLEWIVIRCGQNGAIAHFAGKLERLQIIAAAIHLGAELFDFLKFDLRLQIEFVTILNLKWIRNRY